MIEKQVVLACKPERAFELFTLHAGSWWPRQRRHTGDAGSVIRMEAGGRFFERAGDGREVELGVVRAFEPAHRLLLDWYPGTGPDSPTEVEVLFEEFEGGTRIKVFHRAGAAGEQVFTRNAGLYERSWTIVLETFRSAIPVAAIDS